ncbi:homologous-pairing protein 2 homolog isoform X2 [Columba livia]|uniref:homologous-pairing protein 2 homolog isoform X2 n=1 Tax=Columba livia TaxID=8932 RepID=UPI0031BB5C75
MSKGREGPAAGGAAAVLFQYLREQNRPYSAQDAFGNLQREHGLGKAAVVKALEQLAQQGRVREKTYGKQKIYFADQEQLPAASDAELRALDEAIAALSAKVQAAQQSCRHMEAELKELNGSMTTPEVAREIEELRKDCANYMEKLERIKSATNHVTPEEKEKVCSEQKLYCKEWRRRKRMATELLDAILEGYPKSKKQFFVSTGAVAALPGRASALRAALCSPRRRRSGSRRTRSTTSRCPRLCEAPGGSLPHGDAADAETQLLGCIFPLFFRAWAGPVYLYGFGLKCFAVGVSKTQH